MKHLHADSLFTAANGIALQPKVCSHPDPQNPTGVCQIPLEGRGRSRWCPEHSKLVHAERKRLRSARDQGRWREKHAELAKWNKAIYRRVANAKRFISKMKLNGSEFHKQLIRVYKCSCNPDAHFHLPIALPHYFYADLIFDAIPPVESRENKPVTAIAWILGQRCRCKELEVHLCTMTQQFSAFAQLFVDLGWKDESVLVIPLRLPDGANVFYAEVLKRGSYAQNDLQRMLVTSVHTTREPFSISFKVRHLERQGL